LGDRLDARIDHVSVAACDDKDVLTVGVSNSAIIRTKAALEVTNPLRIRAGKEAHNKALPIYRRASVADQLRKGSIWWKSRQYLKRH